MTFNNTVNHTTVEMHAGEINAQDVLSTSYFTVSPSVVSFRLVIFPVHRFYVIKKLK